MRDQLVLNQAQVAVIEAAAAGVPCAWRDRFWSIVSDRLTALERVTDGDIVAIADAARVRLIAGMGDE